MACQHGLHILVKIEMLACASVGDIRLRVTAAADGGQQHCPLPPLHTTSVCALSTRFANLISKTPIQQTLSK